MAHKKNTPLVSLNQPLRIRVEGNWKQMKGNKIKEKSVRLMTILPRLMESETSLKAKCKSAMVLQGWRQKGR